MSEIVSVSQAAAYLGLGETEEIDAALVGLLNQVEALFIADCGRADAPFRGVQAGRTERLDGNAARTLYLAYPVAALTSVKLGYVSADPDETLDVTDREVLIWDVGSRRLTRIDGGVFGYRGAPSYVQVVYNAAADRPVNAEAAILRGVSALYLQRGAEDVGSEQVGGYQADMAAALDTDPVWRRAVEANRLDVVR